MLKMIGYLTVLVCVRACVCCVCVRVCMYVSCEYRDTCLLACDEWILLLDELIFILFGSDGQFEILKKYQYSLHLQVDFHPIGSLLIRRGMCRESECLTRLCLNLCFHVCNVVE